MPGSRSRGTSTSASISSSPTSATCASGATDVRAVVLTHGHEDHVGALPYLLREVPVPEVWATRLTLGLVKSKLDEHGSALRRGAARGRAGRPAGRRSGPSECEFVRMAHSIPDAVAVVLDTPGGRIVHTGDYKIDHTPVDGFRTDIGKLADLGNRGVDLMLGDSTNAERPGVTPSERTVGEAFRSIIPQRQGRDADRVLRLERAPDAAGDRGRDRDRGGRSAIVGRSLRKNLNIARNLGYIDVPEDMLVRPADLDELRPEEMHDPLHRQPGRAALRADPDRLRRPSERVGVEEGDTVIISAKPVPGNELRVHDTINRLDEARAPRSCTRRSRPCTCRGTGTPTRSAP